MKAYLENPKLKKDFVKEILWHQEQDAIIQGTYGRVIGDQWKGCAVGCSLKSLNKINKKSDSTEDHKRYESELGIPKELALLEDKIFEGLPVKDAKKWPLQFARSIEAGTNLSMVAAKFKLWLMDEKNICYKVSFPDGKKVIKMVRQVLKNFIKNGEYNHAAGAAGAAAGDAGAAAGDAAGDAAWAAGAAARAAARAAWAAGAAAGDAARAAEYKKQAKKLLQLLREAE